MNSFTQKKLSFCRFLSFQILQSSLVVEYMVSGCHMFSIFFFHLATDAKTSPDMFPIFYQLSFKLIVFI